MRNDAVPPTDQIPRQTTDATIEKDLAALVAHEFRGPVHSLQAYLSVLLRERAGPLTDVQKDFLTSMQAVTRRLERLTNDIQVMTSPHSRFSIVPHQVDLWQLADACRWELAPLAQDFQVTLQMAGSQHALAGDALWQLQADGIRLEQVLLNLMENAIRYAAVGSTVQLRLSQSRSRVLVTVSNEVESVPEHGQVVWLAPFQRGATSFERHPRGSGLGMHVITTLVEAHAGRLLTRVRGRQVTIAVCLPRQPRLASAPAA